MAQAETIQERKRLLALSLDLSRLGITTSGRALRRRLHPVRAAGACLRRHPLGIFAASTGAAALLTCLLRPRSRETHKRKSFPRRLAGWTLSLAAPALRSWFLKQAKSYLDLPSAPPSTDSLLGH
jgi:hypothetical protein